MFELSEEEANFLIETSGERGKRRRKRRMRRDADRSIGSMIATNNEQEPGKEVGEIAQQFFGLVLSEQALQVLVAGDFHRQGNLANNPPVFGVSTRGVEVDELAIGPPSEA